MLEQLQLEFNKLKNEVENYRVKCNLLKTEYEKVKNQNKRLKRILQDKNAKISTYIDTDE